VLTKAVFTDHLAFRMNTYREAPNRGVRWRPIVPLLCPGKFKLDDRATYDELREAIKETGATLGWPEDQLPNIANINDSACHSSVLIPFEIRIEARGIYRFVGLFSTASTFNGDMVMVLRGAKRMQRRQEKRSAALEGKLSENDQLRVDEKDAFLRETVRIFERVADQRFLAWKGSKLQLASNDPGYNPRQLRLED
jgi:hypothetical protein